MLKQMKLKIKLKSDLICGSGEGWSNIIDNDITYDNYGFPYIPAKRIKGLLREACTELEEMGMNEPGTSDLIFGNESSQGSEWSLTNAVLDNLEYMKNYIEYCNQDEKKEFTISNVINHYTSVRAQTAIDENGISKENSLRSSRAILRENVFRADIVFDEKYESVMKNCCAITHHMGTNRTRGFGEVQLSMENLGIGDNEIEKVFDPEYDKRYVLKLKLKNKSQLSLKTCKGDKCVDYIPGGAILGFFVERYLKNNEADKEFYRLFIEDDKDGIVFENAYISDCNWNEYEPNRISLYKEKTGENMSDQIVQGMETTKIWHRIKNKYICSSTRKIIEPGKEMVFHHRRPKDKTIGHVIDNNIADMGVLYQKEVLSPDQHFIAKIRGTGRDLRKIFDPYMEYIQIGGSKYTQYGNISIEGFELIPEADDILKKGTEVVCTLQSATVVLDQKGESILNINRLSELLGLGNMTEHFAEYVPVGGYNSKWKLQKPSYVAYAPGTCVRGILEKDSLRHLHIGILQHEGMGEIVVKTVEEIKSEVDIVEQDVNQKEIKNNEYASNLIIPKDLKQILIDSVKHKTRLRALEALKSEKPDELLTAASIGRLLKMLQNNSWKLFIRDCNDIADAQKNKKIMRYIDIVKEKCDKVIEESFLKNYLCDDEILKFKEDIYIIILRDMFTMAKYERRNK